MVTSLHGMTETTFRTDNYKRLVSHSSKPHTVHVHTVILIPRQIVMLLAHRPVWDTSRPQLTDAYTARRRPRPPGSSYLLDPDLDIATVPWNLVQYRNRLITLALRPADTPILPRKAFTNEQRKAVCEMAERTNMSHKELATIFNTNKKTIAQTLKNKDMWLKFDLTGNAAKVARRRCALGPGVVG